ncbi:DUF2508 family protein [Paenibacillus sp. KS-LC4]|uniref:DUF2508 family protein n=1 Tax=Paenibacillus sp. KS-LC4 TaxID=2979727 RepID=UPI0030CE0EF0
MKQLNKWRSGNMTEEKKAVNGVQGEMDALQWTDQLRQEIYEAHMEWENANRFFDYALGKDQIDYAIYAIITAEKRYDSLLRTAKRACKSWSEWRAVQ